MSRATLPVTQRSRALTVGIERCIPEDADIPLWVYTLGYHWKAGCPWMTNVGTASGASPADTSPANLSLFTAPWLRHWEVLPDLAPGWLTQASGQGEGCATTAAIRSYTLGFYKLSVSSRDPALWHARHRP